MKIELKVWGGISGIALIVVVAFNMYLVADTTQNMQNLQYVGNQCFMDKVPQECSQLLDFGVSPEMFLNDDGYRKEINAKAIKILEGAPLYADDIAKFTLNNAGSKGVQLSAEVLKILNEIIQSK